MADPVPQPVRDCFVIMAFGWPDTEQVWTDVFVPTIRACSLNAVRSGDAREDGRTLYDQIIALLRAPSTRLVLADLTYARPNCYDELGYARGFGRQKSVVHCCREDPEASPHSDEAEEFTEGGLLTNEFVEFLAEC